MKRTASSSIKFIHYSRKKWLKWIKKLKTKKKKYSVYDKSLKTGEIIKISYEQVLVHNTHNIKMIDFHNICSLCSRCSN